MKAIATNLANSAPHLTAGEAYLVVGVCQDFVRVINDNDEPVLYPLSYFDISDPLSVIEPNWVTIDYGDGEFEINPPQLSERGFYEDWFDGNAGAKEKLSRYLQSVNV